MNIIEIDLENKSTQDEITRLIGKKLKFADWVSHNWNAFEETITCLNTGGNYQPNIKYEFPLTLIFKNIHEFKEIDPEDYKMLLEILEDAIKFYKEIGLEFNFILD